MDRTQVLMFARQEFSLNLAHSSAGWHQMWDMDLCGKEVMHGNVFSSVIRWRSFDFCFFMKDKGPYWPEATGWKFGEGGAIGFQISELLCGSCGFIRMSHSWWQHPLFFQWTHKDKQGASVSTQDPQKTEGPQLGEMEQGHMLWQLLWIIKNVDKENYYHIGGKEIYDLGAQKHDRFFFW